MEFKFRSHRATIPAEILDNFLALQDEVGDAIETDGFLQSTISSEKLKFYENHIDQVRERGEKT